MKHPINVYELPFLIQELRLLTKSKKVVRRHLGDDMFAYKYNDGKSIKGVARLARGLILNEPNGGDNAANIVLTPMPKFDELTAFSADVDIYYGEIASKLPDTVIVQPKHDGTCVHAVRGKDGLMVATFLSTSNEQTLAARKHIGDAELPSGTSLGFELIDENDQKVQKKRAQDGLYLFYGVDSSGNVLKRDELNYIASNIPNCKLVKEKRMTRDSLLLLLRRLDDVDSIDDLQEGVVAFVNDERVKIKSWQYLRCSSCTFPSISWIGKTIRSVTSMDAFFEKAEAFSCPLDGNVKLWHLIVEVIERAKVLMNEILSVPVDSGIDEIKGRNPNIHGVLFRRRKCADGWIHSEEALIQILRIVVH